MEYRILSNGVRMPMLGFGVFQVDDPAVCEWVVGEAIETGYRLFDTAMTYRNESALGRAVHQSGIPRKEFFITTKAWITDMGYDRTLRAFDRSLQELGMDYLDLYLLHMPFGDYYGAWRAMERLYREGRVRAIGVSNFSAARLIDLSYNFEVLPMVNQIELHVHYQREGELAVMRELGVQPQAWAPFAEGLKGDVHRPRADGHSPQAWQDHGAGDAALEPSARRGGHPQVGTPGAHCRELRRVELRARCGGDGTHRHARQGPPLDARRGRPCGKSAGSTAIWRTPC